MINVDLNLVMAEDTVDDLLTNPVQLLQVCNKGDALEQITLQIASSSQAMIPLSLELPRLEAGEQVEIPLAEQLVLNEEYLQHLCHGLVTEVVVTISQAGEVIAGMARQITLGGSTYEE